MSAAEIQRLAKFYGNFFRFFSVPPWLFPLFHFSTCNRKVLLSWAKIHFSIIYIIIYIILIYNIFTFPKPWISFELFLAMAELKRASFCSFGLRKTLKSKVEKWKTSTSCFLLMCAWRRGLMNWWWLRFWQFLPERYPKLIAKNNFKEANQRLECLC